MRQRVARWDKGGLERRGGLYGVDGRGVRWGRVGIRDERGYKEVRGEVAPLLQSIRDIATTLVGVSYQSNDL